MNTYTYNGDLMHDLRVAINGKSFKLLMTIVKKLISENTYVGR